MTGQRRTERVFLLLVLAQAAHSIEETMTRLYDAFPPTRFLFNRLSDDPAVSFAWGNVVLVLFGLWCWWVPVRGNWRWSRRIAWLWSLGELSNGTVHSTMALVRGGYFPGVITAPLLLALAVGEMVLLSRHGNEPTA